MTEPEREHNDATRPRDSYHEPDRTFGLQVVRELADRGEWGPIHFTAENATIGGIGPAALARELGHEPDPNDRDVIEEVADAVVEGFAFECEGAPDGQPTYGPETSDETDDAQCGLETPHPDALDDHHRLNEGKDWGGHLVYAELARLERAGVEVQDHRIVETADDNHPDLLEIEYAGVSAGTIEGEHRYRHIDSTRYYGVASRPLSEIPERVE